MPNYEPCPLKISVHTGDFAKSGYRNGSAYETKAVFSNGIVYSYRSDEAPGVEVHDKTVKSNNKILAAYTQLSDSEKTFGDMELLKQCEMMLDVYLIEKERLAKSKREAFLEREMPYLLHREMREGYICPSCKSMEDFTISTMYNAETAHDQPKKQWVKCFECGHKGPKERFLS